MAGLISATREWLSGRSGNFCWTRNGACSDELRRMLVVTWCITVPRPRRRLPRRRYNANVTPGRAVARGEVCEEQAWPLSEHAADVVVLQHGLDFCLSPEACVKPPAPCVQAAIC